MKDQANSSTFEKTKRPISGYIMVFLCLSIMGYSIYQVITFREALYILSFIFGLFMITGTILINPNTAKVLLLFGKYKGTVKKNGLYWVNPFYAKRKISLRASNFDSERLKVNDKIGNPIMISTILVWRVTDTYLASFEVDDYKNFVRVQTDAAVRKLASMYPYDNFEDGTEDDQVTLRSSINEVSEALEKEIQERLSMAGIEVLEARIGYLAYAQEIANAMLKRQQATAIVAARHKIVEGAVGMVEMALQELSEKEVVKLDEKTKASMVSNLMVVLCSDKDAAPIVNTTT